MSGEDGGRRRDARRRDSRGASGHREVSQQPDEPDEPDAPGQKGSSADRPAQAGKPERPGKAASADESAPSGPNGGGPAAPGGPKPQAAQWSWPTPVPESRAARVAVYVALFALGVLTAAAGALVQGGWFPGGLLLALAGAVGLFWGGAKLCRTRLGAALPGAGWVVTVFLLTSPRPEGDFVFAAGAGSYVFLLGGVLAAVMCATIALPAPPVPGHKYR